MIGDCIVGETYYGVVDVRPYKVKIISKVNDNTFRAELQLISPDGDGYRNQHQSALLTLAEVGDLDHIQWDENIVINGSYYAHATIITMFQTEKLLNDRMIEYLQYAKEVYDKQRDNIDKKNNIKILADKI